MGRYPRQTTGGEDRDSDSDRDRLEHSVIAALKLVAILGLMFLVVWGVRFEVARLFEGTLSFGAFLLGLIVMVCTIALLLHYVAKSDDL